MRGAKVLVVDDEKAAVEILKRYLELYGHRVVGAGSAEEALELLRGTAVDAVLLDVVLPGRTGLQALADMLKLTKAPIHMMSGQSDDEARRDAQLLGASGFFPKPLELRDVADAIDSLPGESVDGAKARP